MKFKNKKKVIEALDDCLIFINKKLEKNKDKKKDSKKVELEKVA